MSPLTKEFEIQNIWDEYLRTRDFNLRERLVLFYLPFVKGILSSFSIPKNSVLTKEDLTSAGILGLIWAIEKYNPEFGVKFEVYAQHRIKGSILDELRKVDWLSRSSRNKAEKFLKIIEQIESEITTDSEFVSLSERLEVDETELRKYFQAYNSYLSANFVRGSQIIDSEEEVNLLENIPDDSKTPLENIVSQEKIEVITDFLKSLPERSRLIITLYYYENLTLKEIGKLLNISESRVCQIHSEVIAQLKSKFQSLDF